MVALRRVWLLLLSELLLRQRSVLLWLLLAHLVRITSSTQLFDAEGATLAGGKNVHLGWTQLILNQEIELLHVEVLHVSQAWWTVSLVAIQTEEAVLVAGDHGLAPGALASLVAGVGTDHPLARLVLRAGLEPLNALLAHAEAEALL